MKRYYINRDGQLEEVNKFSPLYHIEAENKTEAMKKILAFARICIESPPMLKFKGDAWQLSYAFTSGTCVEAGRKSLGMPLCSQTIQHGCKVLETHASFDYYANLAE